MRQMTARVTLTEGKYDPRDVSIEHGKGSQFPMVFVGDDDGFIAIQSLGDGEETPVQFVDELLSNLIRARALSFSRTADGIFHLALDTKSGKPVVYDIVAA